MRYQSKEEKLDTKKIRGEEKVARQQIDDTSSFAHKAETIIQQLCDEVDRLKEKVSDQGEEKRLREAVQVQMRRNRRQYRKIQELEKAPQPPTRVGRIIDEQEKEIAELKAELITRTQLIFSSDTIKADQRGEIAELKKSLGSAREVIRGNGKALVRQQEEIAELKEELESIKGACTNLVPRQKLTKAIKGIIDEWKYFRCSVNGKLYPDIASLKRVLEEFGAK